MPGRRLLFVHAHPDDETLATGATIAESVARGDDVCVLTCTRGEQGEVIPPELAHLRGNEALLSIERMHELDEAMTVLGVTKHYYLGEVGARLAGQPPRRYRDSGMRWGEDGHPRALDSADETTLCGSDLAEVAGDIVQLIHDFRPDVVIAPNQFGGYGHPDHIRVHEATLLAVEWSQQSDELMLMFSVERPARIAAQNTAAVEAGGRFSGIVNDAVNTIPDHLIDVVIDARSRRATQLDAVRAYRTQAIVDGDEVAMSNLTAERVTGIEYFREVSGAGELKVARPASDFVEGWRYLRQCAVGLALGERFGLALLSIVFGAVAAGICTVVHGTTWQVTDSLSLPTGLVLSVLALGVACLGLRLASETRLWAVCFAVAAIAVIAVISATGPGGDVLVKADPAGYVFTYATGAILLAIVIAPRLRAE